jgi:hypothetical protein
MAALTHGRIFYSYLESASTAVLRQVADVASCDASSYESYDIFVTQILQLNIEQQNSAYNSKQCMAYLCITSVTVLR